MKRLTQITLVAAVLVMASGAALAQQQRQRQRPGGGGFGGGFGTMSLLTQPSIQKELKLSEEQITKVKELSDKRRESFGGLRDLSQEERRTKMQELMKANDKAVSAILNAKQMKRAKQLALQQQGGRALSNEEVVKALKLSDEQKEKIKDIQTKAREASGGRPGAGQRDRSPEALAKREEARKATTEKVMGVLTAEQKTKLKELQGEPFKFEPRTGGRRRPTPPTDKNS